MAAILATGGAALAVNATVMDPQSGTNSTSSDAPQETLAPLEEPNLAANEFQIPGVGLVSLMTIGGKLALESVVVNEGFTYVISESSPGQFDIRFESPDRVVTFTAQLTDGQIVTSATSVSTSPPAPQETQPTQPPADASAPASGGGSGSGSIDYDDDDYDYDDDDYDYDDDDHGGFEHDDHDDDD
jgi:hypothetical protein